jgi:hypothetical protein
MHTCGTYEQNCTVKYFGTVAHFCLITLINLWRKTYVGHEILVSFLTTVATGNALSISKYLENYTPEKYRKTCRTSCKMSIIFSQILLKLDWLDLIYYYSPVSDLMKIRWAVLNMLHEGREVHEEVNGHIFVNIVVNTLNFWNVVQEW